MSWINDLDACASAGVISFDAPAYVKVAQPRYYGNPDFAHLPEELVPMKQPSKDEFKNSDPHNNPTWKKVLFGALAIGGLSAVIYALSKGKINLKNINIVETIKNIPTKIKNLHLMDKLKNLFKKPATP